MPTEQPGVGVAVESVGLRADVLAALLLERLGALAVRPERCEPKGAS
jgi:hypothetical protein